MKTTTPISSFLTDWVTIPSSSMGPLPFPWISQFQSNQILEETKLMSLVFTLESPRLKFAPILNKSLVKFASEKSQPIKRYDPIIPNHEKMDDIKISHPKMDDINFSHQKMDDINISHPKMDDINFSHQKMDDINKS
jgi:hypothetical protein